GDIAERGGKSVLVQGAGAHPPGGLPHLLDERLRLRVRLLEQRRRASGIRRPASAGEHHQQGDDVLLYDRLHYTRDPIACAVRRRSSSIASTTPRRVVSSRLIRVARASARTTSVQRRSTVACAHAAASANRAVASRLEVPKISSTGRAGRLSTQTEKSNTTGWARTDCSVLPSTIPATRSIRSSIT